MTATAGRPGEATRTSGQVIQLHSRKRVQDTSANPEMARLVREALASNMMVEEITTKVEAAIIKNVSRQFSASRFQDSSAFDAVYLADLTPDPVDQVAVGRLAQFAHVQDLSDTIEFADGWDD